MKKSRHGVSFSCAKRRKPHVKLLLGKATKKYTKPIVALTLIVVILASLWLGTFGMGEAWVLRDESPCGRTRQYIRINGTGPKYNMTILAIGNPQECGLHPHYSDGQVEEQFYLNIQHFQQWRHLKLYREDNK